jgi:hypothetical protein
MIKVLLLDTNISSYPIYKYLISLNFDVYVVGSNQTDFLAKICEKYFHLDYSKHDILLEYIKVNKFKFIIPGCNDISYLALSRIGQYYKVYGVDNIETSLKLFDKSLFKELAIELNINVPRVYDINDFKFRDNIIIKPVDSFSGRGISVIINNSDLKNLNYYIENAKKYSSNGKILIEDYINGDLYSHSAFIKNGLISNDFIIKEFCNVYKYAVDLSWLDKKFPNRLLAKIRYSIELIIKKLNLVDGLIHTQFILKENDIWILEITRRCPGDLYSRLIELSTNFFYNEEYTNNFINIQNSSKHFSVFNNTLFRQTISTSDNIYFNGLIFNSKVKIQEIYPITSIGTYLSNKNFSKVAIMFFEPHNKHEIFNKSLDSYKYFKFI